MLWRTLGEAPSTQKSLKKLAFKSSDNMPFEDPKELVKNYQDPKTGKDLKNKSVYNSEVTHSLEPGGGEVLLFKPPFIHLDCCHGLYLNTQP